MDAAKGGSAPRVEPNPPSCNGEECGTAALAGLPSRSEFDEQAYLALHLEVADAVRRGQMASGWDHFIRHGFAEGWHWVRKNNLQLLPPAKIETIADFVAGRNGANGNGRSVRKSCMHIESSIIFHQNKLLVCCIKAPGGGSPLICEYKGGRFPMDKILAKRKEIQEANRTGTYPACAGCPCLQEKEWPDSPPYPIAEVNVTMSPVCELRCNYCFTLEGDKTASSYDLYDTCREILDNNWFAPNADIMWAGGEPTILKRFDQTLNLLMAGNIRHHVFTNSVRYSESVARGLQSGKMDIIVSLDAGTPETYATVKGRPWFDRVTAVLTRYARTGGDVRLKFIGLPENSNRKDADGFLELLRRLQIRNAYLDTDYNQPKPSPQTIETLGYILAKARDNGTNVHFFSGLMLSRDLENGRPVEPAGL